MSLLEPFDHVGQISRNEELEMVNVGGCPFGRVKPIYKNNKRTGDTYKERCNSCEVCRMQKHSTDVGAAMAEAYMSAAVVFLTLTYANDPETGAVPPGAQFVDYSHVQKFLKFLRRTSAVKSISVGEYGGDTARAHFHMLLFFPWDEQRREEQIRVFSEQVGKEAMDLDHAANWQSRLPPFVMPNSFLEQDEFKALLDDPDVLYLGRPDSGSKHINQPAQSWKFWPHGNVNAQLIDYPLTRADNRQAVRRSISYCMKYVTKDSWRDNIKYSRLDFADLPEHIKESTRFGRVEYDGPKRKFKGPNEYGLKMDEEDALSGLEKTNFRRRKPKFVSVMRGGVGHDYFKALGLLHGRAGYENKIYTIPGVFDKARRGSLLTAIEKGVTLDSQFPMAGNRKSRFMMKEIASHTYGQALVAAREATGYDETDGQGGWISALDNRVHRRRDKQSGKWGFERWEKADSSQRKRLEKEWSFMSDLDARELIPSRLYSMFLETSDLGDWPEKRRRLKFSAQYGYVAATVPVRENDVVYIMSGGKLLFERRLPTAQNNEAIWWRREVETMEQLELVAIGKFVSQTAMSLRREREGRGDQTSVTGWKQTRVKRFLSAARRRASQKAKTA